MAHVELTLSELSDAGRDGAGRRPGGHAPVPMDRSLDLWAATVDRANEPCLLVDAQGVVVSASPGCRGLFGVDVGEVVDRPLVDGVLRFLDFNAVSGELPGWDVNKIPPLLAITSQGLARGLLRVSGHDSPATTVDAISTPLLGADGVVGSLTFFALVGR